MLSFGICLKSNQVVLAALVGLVALGAAAQQPQQIRLKTPDNSVLKHQESKPQPILKDFQLPNKLGRRQIEQLLKAQGPESGGGGGVVRINDSLHLVDYFLIPQALPQIQAWHQNPANSSDFMNEASEDVIEFSHREQRAENRAFELAFEILEKWANLPFDHLAYLMQGSFQTPLKWLFVDEDLFSIPSYRPAFLAPQIPIVTAANYTILQHQLYLVRINRPLWNELALFHQTGLILHEVLRQVQLGKQSYFNDESLQKATAILMLCEPSLKLNQYAHFLTFNAEAVATERLGRFEDVTQNCRGPK